MALISLEPHIDTLTGSTSTPARFTAQARQALRAAVRVDGATATFPATLVFDYDGTTWNAPPELEPLPIGCYWETSLVAQGAQNRRTVILPPAADTVAYGDLIDVVPDTAEIDTRIQQWSAVQQTITSAVAQVAAYQAQIAELEATLQSLLAQTQDALNAVPASVLTALNGATVGGVLAGNILAPSFDTDAVDAFLAARIGDDASATAAALSTLVDTALAAQHVADEGDFDPAGAAADAVAAITVIDGNA